VLTTPREPAVGLGSHIDKAVVLWGVGSPVATCRVNWIVEIGESVTEALLCKPYTRKGRQQLGWREPGSELLRASST